MPRKAAAAATDAPAAPRRSARIKDQPKPESVAKKAPAKPRGRKPKAAAAEQADEDTASEKPVKGKKRTASEVEAEDATLANGASNDEDQPPPTKRAKPASKVGSKPPSKAAVSKPASKAAGTSSKPASKAAGTSSKPASKVSRAGSTKPASRASVKPPSASGVKKPASRAGSRKPPSKVGTDEKENEAVPPALVQETITEQPEEEDGAEDVATVPEPVEA